MQEKVVVVTGASSGIGKVAARQLAADGWRVIAVGRDLGRTAQAAKELAASKGGQRIEMLRADISVMAEVEALANAIAARTDRIDVLLNNAGGVGNRLVMTDEGLEQTLAGNHLGPMLLTQRLLPLLRAAAADQPSGTVRIINTSSAASEMISALDIDDLQCLNGFDPGGAYCAAKLGNILFTRSLARRLAAEDITVHAVHPGVVDSNFYADLTEEMEASTRDLPKLSEEAGADTLIWLTTNPEGAKHSGTYWHERAPRAVNPIAENADFAEQHWTASEGLIAKALSRPAAALALEVCRLTDHQT